MCVKSGVVTDCACDIKGSNCRPANHPVIGGQSSFLPDVPHLTKSWKYPLFCTNAKKNGTEIIRKI